MAGILGARRLNIGPEIRARASALTAHNRQGTVPLPAYIGRPGMVLISDSHGAVDTYLKLYEALPSTVRFGIDLGDKVDRGPSPIEMNYVLQTLRVRRVLGNHDAMWVAAGLGVPAQSIELVRWLMRYNEVDFLTSALGVDLKPLTQFAGSRFSEGAHRIDVKSKRFKSEEAAATYLKIIAEAGVRFPEHRSTELSPSDLRIREALFLKGSAEALAPSERDIFNRLTGDAPLSGDDQSYFYRLMGGLKVLQPEEQAVVNHFANEFRNNYAFYQFVKWMAGEGDLYLNFRIRQGYSSDILALHATVPLTADGELAEFDGRYGREALLHLKDRIQLGLEAWRQMLEHDDQGLLEMHQNDISVLGLLPWDRRSPIYARQMQTAARAVLNEKTGTWEEPKEPFFSVFEKGEDLQALANARRNIAASFGFRNPNNFVIVRGHEPSKDGMFQVFAGGTVINIDGGMAEKYGGKGGALVMGSAGAAWLAYPSMNYTRVPLPESV
ncbi:hypothetical protein A2625_06185 [candidate division WOR-1 bacterium RIFCSPHIGHO2_01_FULL_53_15]|uniref:Calcineurin-like phosphoesterase domain-containing protein n=1 Tax=candidate division WOR-1 bacterium RIFCSPHIGHO2_01_FULL_53_15 TaxID=1802564 RepID=A0A1F4Q1E5_UNCSA|nr:MAG: hypothetical protein A2625_06185 [candidate division WOR-1 bacterium RIFCSPHIGHO2_01_FULL_53_15]OGC13824.1 MAG: hypothetical protein A3D23_02035 [candidate division WOR-1 bacterium RIFCSPHIGHO2_02_FULL_53_26]